MKYYGCLYICVLLSLPASLRAVTDTLSVQEKMLNTELAWKSFRSQIWKNPSMNYYHQDFSMTTLGFDGMYEHKGKASLVQEGTGYKGGEVNASSFIKLSENNKVFGTASYSNGRYDNVRWNENSDFSVVYPYVTGDSIGGYLKNENYKFAGGYAHEWKEWTLGAQFAYRATLAYRDKDPRPRNIISDLSFSISAAHTLGGSYLVGLALNVRKYSQKSDIKFLADKGSTSVYQMLGLGVEYVRFAGTQTSSNYRGKGIGGSLDLLPKKGDGVSATLTFDYFTLTKELTSLNNAPINEIADFKLGSEIVWTYPTINKWKYGIKLNADFSLRNGTENIFGDPTGNVYPIFSSVDQYKNMNTQAVLTGLIENVALKKHYYSWSLMPYIGYKWLKPEYKGNNRFVDISSLTVGIQTRSIWKWNKTLLTVGLDGGYTSNLKTSYSLPGLDTTKSLGTDLMANINYLGDNYASMALSLRGDYSITSRHAVFLSGRWLYQSYKVCGSANFGELSFGLVF